jgi:hypothetical protein
MNKKCMADKGFLRLFIWGAGIVAANCAFAAPSGITSGGTSGYYVVPDGNTLNAGDVAISFSNYESKIDSQRFPSLERYGATIGLFKNLEIGGIANFTDVGNAGIGLRDLGFNVKLSLPSLYAWMPNFALGLEDVGGQRNFFEARYIASSYQWRKVGMTLGYGEDSDNVEGGFSFGSSRLKGVFGGLRIELPLGFDFSGEFDGQDPLYSLRWVFPAWRQLVRLQSSIGYLPPDDEPKGHGLSVGVVALFSLGSATKNYEKLPHFQNKENEYQGILSASPMVEVKSNKDDDKEFQSANNRLEISNSDAKGAPVYEEWRKKLIAKGFKNVNLYIDSYGVPNVDFENVVFRNNELHALGVAMGLVSENMNCGVERVSFVMRRDGVPLLRFVSGRAWLMNKFQFGDACGESETWRNIITNGISVEIYPKINNKSLVSNDYYEKAIDISIYPKLRYFLATEISALEYSTALAADLKINTWKGGVANFKVVESAIESEEFNYSKAFDLYSVPTGLDTIAFRQFFSPSSSWLAQISVGRFDRYFDGGYSEVRSLLFGRGLQIGASAGWLRDQRDDQYRRFGGGFVQYGFLPSGVTTRLAYDRYLYGDYGPSIELGRDFRHDVRLSFFAIHTNINTVGMRVRLPLSTRKAWTVGPFSVRGSDAWSTQLKTSVGDINYVYPDAVRKISPDYSIERNYLNNDRWSVEYIKNNIWLMQEAYILERRM